MRELYILREKSNADNRFNAGSKAKEDVDTILTDMGAYPVECEFDFTESRSSSGKLKKILYHIKTMSSWKNQLRSIPDEGIVVIQFPVKAHTVFLGSVIASLKRRHIKSIAIIHDLDTLRNSIYYGNNSHGLRLKLEEISALKKFDIVIAHNKKMKETLSKQLGVAEGAIVPLDIFDYIIPDETIKARTLLGQSDESVIIAGNLDPDKCGYLYNLPSEPTFELYGANYRETDAGNVHYNGAFLPDELPANMRGRYGLVWDGNVASTCSGIFGEYLKINNPHKTSLYLASGIPVIVWKEAAIADFISANECGFTVQSIDEISDILKTISEEKYFEMRTKAEIIGERLRKGYYTTKAVTESAKLIKDS